MKKRIEIPIYNEKLVMPVGVFWGGPKELWDKHWMSELKELGTTVILGTYPELSGKTLDWAMELGMKVLVYDDFETMTPEDAIKCISMYKDHPAYLGIQIADEPSDDRIISMGPMCRAIVKADPGHFIWVNLLPYYAGYPTLEHYDEHIDLFIDNCTPNLMTFDYYPIIGGSVRKEYYENTLTHKRRAMELGIPLWTFILCTVHGGYTDATIEAMRFQYSNELAMGSQGIQWFTGGTPGPVFREAPLDPEGKRTPTFYRVQQINREFLPYAHILMAVDYVGTLFCMQQENKPILRQEMKEWEPVQRITGDPVIVGCFNGKRDDKFLYVANYSYKENASVQIFPKIGRSPSYQLWDSEGSEERMFKNDSIAIDLKPGEGKLIQYQYLG